MLHNILLVCEVFIALFGIFAVIIADNTHERLHGLFVVGLALEGFLSHALPENSPITATVLIVLTIIAFLMIIISFHSLIEHLRRYFHHVKNPNVVPHHPSLNVGQDYSQLHAMIENNFAKLEQMLLDREKLLAEREKQLEEREKQVEIALQAQSEVAVYVEENK